FAQLHLAAPVSIPAREHLVLRLPSPARTVAGGLILEAETARLRRHAPTVLQRLSALAVEDAAATVRREVAEAGAAGMSLRRLARLTGLAPAKVAALLQTERVVIGRKGVAVARDALDALAAGVVAILDRHGAHAREAIAAALLGAGADVLDEALARLAGAGTIRHAGGVCDVKRPEAEAARAQDEARVERALAEALRRGRLAPPDAAAL